MATAPAAQFHSEAWYLAWGEDVAVHTVCQHVFWERLLPLWQALGVSDRHLSHCEPKSAAIAAPYGVRVHSWPLAAANVVNADRREGLDARMAARALLAAKVPLAMLDFPPGADIPQNDRSMQAHVAAQGPYAFNIFCMTALENGRYYAERGSAQFAGRYNIGYWPWELGRWPKEWAAMLDLVGEVWVSSRHTHDALAPVCAKPVYLMPMAVELGEVRAFRSGRQARAHESGAAG